MRHQNKRRGFKKKNYFEKALYLNLLKSLFIYGKIKTTLKRGRILSSFVTKVLGKALKTNFEVNKKRYLTTIFKGSLNFDFVKYEEKVVSLIKCSNRQGDCAQMVLVRLQ